MSEFKEWAHKYYELGFNIIPVHGILDGNCTCGDPHDNTKKYAPKSKGKHPVHGNWRNNYIKKPLQIDLQWRKPYNIGVATGPCKLGNLVVIDVDHGADEEFVARLPETLMQQSGSGGKQFFYISDKNIRNSQSSFEDNVDVRGDGGQAVLPPSNHHSGNTYQWINWGHEIARLPEWLEDLCVEKREPKEEPSIEIDVAELEGFENNLTEDDYFDDGFSVDQIKEMLECIPSDDRDVWLKVGSALRQEYGDDGLEIFIEWSSKSEKFEGEQDCINLYNSTRDGMVSLGTIVYFAKQNGYTFRREAKEFGEVEKRIASKNSAPPVEEVPASDVSVDQPTSGGKTRKKPPVYKKIQKSPGDPFRGGLKASIEAEVWCYCVQFKKFFALDNNQEIDKEAFNDLYDYFVLEEYGQCFGEKQRIPHASNFVLSRRFVRIVDTVTFYPGRGKITEDGSKLCFNLWTPPEIDPYDGDVSDEDVEPILKHIEYLVCDPVERKTMLDWISHVVQNPGHKMNWSIILCGEVRGTGKSFIGYMMAAMMDGPSDDLDGSNLRMIETHEVQNEFNWYATKSELLFIHELYCEGPRNDQRKIVNKFKNMITERSLTINIKGKSQYQIPNRFNMFFATNYEDAISMDDEENRFYVVTSYAKKRTRKEYDAIWSWIENKENVAKLKRWFFERDISGFKPNGRAPDSHGRDVMAAASKSGVASLMRYMIQENEWPFVGDLINSKELAQRMNAIGHRYGLPKNLTMEKIARELRNIGCRNMKRMSEVPSLISVRNHDKWEKAKKGEKITEYTRWLENNEIERVTL